MTRCYGQEGRRPPLPWSWTGVRKYIAVYPRSSVRPERVVRPNEGDELQSFVNPGGHKKNNTECNRQAASSGGVRVREGEGGSLKTLLSVV